MHVPSAILHAIGWFCHVVRLAQSIQQLSSQSAQVALPLFLWKQNHENRLIYKLLKSFLSSFLSCLKTLKATTVGDPHPRSMLYSSSVQSSAEALRATHTQNKQTDKKTDRRTVGQGICHSWQSHSSFQSHPNFDRKSEGCRQKCGEEEGRRWHNRLTCEPLPFSPKNQAILPWLVWSSVIKSE